MSKKTPGIGALLSDLKLPLSSIDRIPLIDKIFPLNFTRMYPILLCQSLDSERSTPESRRGIQKQNHAERMTAPPVETCPRNTMVPDTLLKPEQCTP
ncbi:MAG: hypothetical protein ACJ0DK_10425 [Planctomycetota bacterium]